MSRAWRIAVVSASRLLWSCAPEVTGCRTDQLGALRPSNLKRCSMANRERRGNREKRKPKSEKAKPPPAQASPFGRVQAVGVTKAGSGKKRG